MVVLYPAFYSIFANLSPSGQTKFVLLLPVIKLFEKNLLSRFLRNRDDVKPEVVIFNVEIFNALFVSCCMQSSTSLNTNLVIMGIDFLQACVSLHDLGQRLAEANKLGDKMQMPKDKLIETTLLILEDFPSIAHHPSFHNILRVYDCASGISPTQINPASFSKWAAAGRESTECQSQKHYGSRSIVPEPRNDSSVLMNATPPHRDQLRQPSGLAQAPQDSFTLDSDPNIKVAREVSRSKSMAAVLTSRERLLFVQKTLQVLFLTEFLLLIEFTEVIIPVVYAVYLIGLYNLPNRIFYPQLRDMDSETLRATVVNIAIYAAMELLSFLVLYVVLKRKLRISAIHQLAFVLDKHRHMVQSKLILWVVFMLQSTLVHLGADYTFKFAWLHHQPPRAE
ncbi:hypothetical protein Gpo141_00008504 [Globisporangium polare]